MSAPTPRERLEALAHRAAAYAPGAALKAQIPAAILAAADDYAHTAVTEALRQAVTDEALGPYRRELAAAEAFPARRPA